MNVESTAEQLLSMMWGYIYQNKWTLAYMTCLQAQSSASEISPGNLNRKGFLLHAQLSSGPIFPLIPCTALCRP